MTKNKTRFWLILGFSALVVIGILLAVIFQFRMQYGTVAQVWVEDRLVEQVDLAAVGLPYTINAGSGNVVLVENGAISMQSANCPDQLCVKQGKITGGVYPIVCLPNRVTVKIVSDSEDTPDVVVGGVGS